MTDGTFESPKLPGGSESPKFPGGSVELAPGLRAYVYRAESDGTLVVELVGEDSAAPEDANGPKLRVYLNEGILFENPAFPGSPEDGQ